MLRLRTLGGLSLERGGVQLDSFAAQRKALAFLAILGGTANGGMSRDKVLGYLWPESDEERARNALNQLLFTLRRQVGTSTLVVGSIELKLNPEVITSDVAQFERALAAGDLEVAVAAYGGAFLDGIYLKDLAEFERWVERERERLAHAYRAALERLARSAEERREPTSAVHWWRQLAAADPLSARVARAYMEALAATGDREAAIRHGRVHAELTRAELDAEPDVALLAFAEQLRAGNGRIGAEAVNGPGGNTVGDAATPPAPRPVRRAYDAPAEPEQIAEPAEERSLDTRSARMRIRRPHLDVAVVAAMAVAVMFGLRARDEPTVVVPPLEKTTGDTALGTVSRMPTEAGAVAVAETSSVAPARAIGRVLVVPFVNETGDTTLAVFGRMAAGWVAEGLAQTGLVDVVDEQTVALLVQPQSGDTAGPAGDTYFRRLVERSGVRTLVTGSFARTASTLDIRARIVEASTGSVLRVVPVISVPRREYSRAVERLRRGVGGAFAALADPRLATLTDDPTPAPTFEAYREFVAGLDQFARNAYRDAIPGFKRATELDSSWALPYFWLAFAFGNSGQSNLRDSVIDVVARRQEQLSALDRHALTFFLAEREGDLEGAYRAVRQASRLAPRSNWTYMRGWIAFRLFRHREAVAALRELDPDYGWVRGWNFYTIELTRALHLLGEYREELAEALRASRRNPQDSTQVVHRVRALAALGDKAELLRLVDSLTVDGPRHESPWIPGWVMANAGYELVIHGDPDEGQRVLDRCVRWIDGVASDTIARPLALNVKSLCLQGAARWSEMRVVGEEMTRLPRVARAGFRRLAVAAAHEGDSTAAERSLMAELRLYPERARADRASYMRAQFAAIRGDKALAVAQLRRVRLPPADPLDLYHLEPAFYSLRDYPPFRALIAPRQ